MEHTPQAPGEPGAILQGRAAWQQALRECLRDPGPQWSLYSEDYSDWPLGEPAVVEALRAWALSRRRPCVRMLARSYERLMLECPRFVRWRTDFGHLLECRELAADLPAPSEGLWLRDNGLLALPAQRERRAVRISEASWQASLLDFEQAWDLAEPGFAPTSLGL